MSVQTDLEEAYTNLVTAFKEATANPKPNYSIQGQSVSHADYLKMLRESIVETGKLLGSVTPFELVSVVI